MWRQMGTCLSSSDCSLPHVDSMLAGTSENASTCDRAVRALNELVKSASLLAMSFMYLVAMPSEYSGRPSLAAHPSPCSLTRRTP